MAQYTTALDIINSAAVECGLSTAVDPFSSQQAEMLQLRYLLTNCGQELCNSFQWQQLVRSATISTGAIPVSSGEYDLPTDFNYMINQTGWTPTNAGVGLPLRGPFSEQTWAAVIATGMATSTIYVSFKVAQRKLAFLPAPAPPNINIGYKYNSRSWVVAADLTTYKDEVTVSTDTILFDRIMMVKMLVTRYKQAKGLDANSSLEQFQLAYSNAVGINVPSPVLIMGGRLGFPFINAWINIPQTGFGS
jgi:hypothetical protein